MKTKIIDKAKQDLIKSDIVSSEMTFGEIAKKHNVRVYQVLELISTTIFGE